MVGPLLFYRISDGFGHARTARMPGPTPILGGPARTGPKTWESSDDRTLIFKDRFRPELKKWEGPDDRNWARNKKGQNLPPVAFPTHKSTPFT